MSAFTSTFHYGRRNSFKNVREDKEISSLNHQGYEYKLRVFADDIVFFPENQIKILPGIIQKINNFGKLAGFYLNQNKSKILHKNMSGARIEALAKFTDCDIVKRVKYLGIEITIKI